MIHQRILRVKGRASPASLHRRAFWPFSRNVSESLSPGARLVNAANAFARFSIWQKADTTTPRPRSNDLQSFRRTTRPGSAGDQSWAGYDLGSEVESLWMKKP